MHTWLYMDAATAICYMHAGGKEVGGGGGGGGGTPRRAPGCTCWMPNGMHTASPLLPHLLLAVRCAALTCSAPRRCWLILRLS